MRLSIYETVLTKLGLDWTYNEYVPMSDINLVKGLKNQARLEAPLDNDLVEQ